MVSRVLVASLIVGLRVVVAPRNVAGSATQPASVDACALYTREEVAALANTTATKPRPSENRFGTVTSNSCWTRASNSSWSVKVNVERSRSSDEIKQMLATLGITAKRTTSVGLKPVTGIGDEAYWGQIDPAHGMLHIVVGKSLLTVETWGRGTGAGTLGPTKEIATLVVKRFKERYPA